MPSWVEEFLIVLAWSRKTQVVLLFAAVMPILMIGLGAFASQWITFGEPFSALAVPVREGIFYRYILVAVFVFLSAVSVAKRQFERARRYIFA